MSDNTDFNDDVFDVPARDIRPSVPLWRTQDGRVMQMSDMTERHLGNALPYTVRRIDGIEELIRAKAQELIEEPYLLPTVAQELSGIAQELDEAVRALRVLREEVGRRAKRKEAAAELRAEVEASR